MFNDIEIYGNMIEHLCESPYNENYVVRQQLNDIYDSFWRFDSKGCIVYTHKLVASLYYYALRHNGSSGVSNSLFDLLETVYCYGKLYIENR